MSAKRIPTTTTEDENWMRLALDLAEKGRGTTSPNPMVGAVIVQGGKKIGAGWHRRPGGPHAEIAALGSIEPAIAGRKLRDCTLYVTLEPCSTTGRTPPCTEAIMSAGIGRVVIGATDPNPKHCGRAVMILKAAGMQVTTRVLEQQCAHLNRAFNQWITTGRPWVIAKVALTLDGRLTLPTSRWLSGPQSRRLVQSYRREVDAVVVGSGTIRADNPRLTIRRSPASRQPWRIVMARSARLPKTSRVLTDELRQHTRVIRTTDPTQLLKKLGQSEILSVLVEGGGSVLGAFIDADAVDELRFFLCPTISGGPVPIKGKGCSLLDGRAFSVGELRRIGNDLLVTALRQRGKQ